MFAQLMGLRAFQTTSFTLSQVFVLCSCVCGNARAYTIFFGPPHLLEAFVRPHVNSSFAMLLLVCFVESVPSSDCHLLQNQVLDGKATRRSAIFGTQLCIRGSRSKLCCCPGVFNCF